MVWPPALSAADRRRAERLLAPVTPDERQAVLDVLAAAMQAGTARKPLALLGALARRWAEGTLDTTPGEAVALARQRRPVAAAVREPTTDEVLRHHARLRGEDPERYLAQFRKANGGRE